MTVSPHAFTTFIAVAAAARPEPVTLELKKGSETKVEMRRIVA